MSHISGLSAVSWLNSDLLTLKIPKSLTLTSCMVNLLTLLPVQSVSLLLGLCTDSVPCWDEGAQCFPFRSKPLFLGAECSPGRLLTADKAAYKVILRSVTLGKISDRYLEPCYCDTEHLSEKIFFFSPRYLKSGRCIQYCITTSYSLSQSQQANNENTAHQWQVMAVMRLRSWPLGYF